MSFDIDDLGILFCVAAFICIVALGCNSSKGKPATGPLPTVTVPIVDTDPVEQSVGKAYVSAVKAKGDLEKNDVPSAKVNVGDTVNELTITKDSEIPKLKAERDAAVAAQKTNQAVCDKAVSEKDKAITDLQDELKKVKDEELTHFKHTLYGIATILALLGACSFACEIYFGFAAGWKIAAICGTMSAILFTFAAMVDTIIKWVTYAGIVGLIVALGFVLYHYFRHTPSISPEPTK